MSLLSTPFTTDISAQSLTLNGVHYPPPCQTPPQEWISKLAIRQPELADLTAFLSEWFSDDPYLTVHTSGSTGRPKPLIVEKKRMIASAVATCSFLKLQPMDSALLCMSVRYIAGKMMVVRALVASLNLVAVAPSSHPLAGLTTPPTFAAMIPMQVHHSLQQPEERKMLSQIKQLIIGGGAIHPDLEAELRDFPYAVWSTYGMTETLSHIALRQLNGPEASKGYKALPGIEVKKNEFEQLVIDAPTLCSETLVTNDVVSFNDAGDFMVRGRIDNTLNSGGVKIQIEEVEALLQPTLSGDFAITSVPHKVWGDKVVLLTTDPNCQKIESLCQKALPSYWQPKEILFVKIIPKTETGKLSRKEIRNMAQELSRGDL
ncbi:MAG: AMP-binding protein [Phocaeicola sp.]